MSAIDEFLAYDEEHGIEKQAGFLSALKGGWKALVEGVTKAPVAPVSEAALKRIADDASALTARPLGERVMHGIGSMARRTGTTMAPVAAIGGVMYGADAAFSAASNAISRSRGFKSMMDNNPDLAKMDQKRVNSAFKTLHRFNPEMASDPYVAGGWVKRVTDYDYVDPKTIGDLVAARSRATKPGIMERGLPLAALGAQMAETEGRKAFEAQKLMVADQLAHRRDQAARDAAQDVAQAQVAGQLAAQKAELSTLRSIEQEKATGKSLGMGAREALSAQENIERRKARGKALGTAAAVLQQPKKFEQAAMPSAMGGLMAQREFETKIAPPPNPMDMEYQKAWQQQAARRDFAQMYPRDDD